MPTETFHNLDDKKRERILNAAREEFTNKKLIDSRVSNIIKKCDIPRGSFYQYFTDLEDLFYYIVNREFDRIFNSGSEFISQTNDLFEYSILTFESDYKAFVEGDRHKFLRNVFHSVDINSKVMTYHREKRDHYLSNLFNQMDLSLLMFETFNDVKQLYIMIQEIKQMVIRKAIFNDWPMKKAKDTFIWRLKIIQNGACQNNE
ncbi:MAG: TetR/AcrR family transcriptional regulator [Candidatus Izimaplasma sp.]|nr:TetR/AcrR family transcriptional regulator [Candidatus Izimaplasma bacterium]